MVLIPKFLIFALHQHPTQHPKLDQFIKKQSTKLGGEQVVEKIKNEARTRQGRNNVMSWNEVS